MRVLCVRKPGTALVGHVGFVGGVLRVSGASPGFRMELKTAIEEIKDRSIFLKVERIKGKEVDVDFTPVGSEHPDYLAAVAEDFFGRGWWARVYSVTRAECWKYLQILPIDRDSQVALLPYLDAMSDEEADELRKSLRKADADLGQVRRKRETSRREVASMRKKLQ